MGLSLEQVLALSIFVFSYGLIISNRVHRTVAALLGALLTTGVLFTGLLRRPPDKWLEVQQWETLVFIFGMLFLIASMAESGFFRWLGLRVARGARLDTLRAFIVLPAMAGGLAAFIDSITVMLFLSALTLELCALLKVKPLPLLLSEIAGANIGGSATLVGDPPNVILGTHFHLTFVDFVTGTGAIALVGFVVNTLFFIFWFRKQIFPRRSIPVESLGDPWGAVESRGFFYLCVGTFFLVVVLLVTHHMTGLSVAAPAMVGFLVLLVARGNKAIHTLERFEWTTLLFFGGLFLIVNGLEVTGLLRLAADGMLSATGGNPALVMSLVLWFAAIGSSIVDNVPFAATMAPLIEHLAGGSSNLRPMIWATALGTDIGGNGTPIGASANVVAVSAYEKATGEKVSWRFYCASSYTAMVLVVGISNLLLLLLYYR